MNADIFTQLIVHQTGLKAAMAETRTLLLAESIDTLAVAHARWRFTRALTGYQMFKHQRIFDPLGRRGTREEANAARQMKIACVGISETFRAFLARWTTTGIGNREDEYRRDARGMIAMLERHIVAERREIGALLAQDRRAA